MSRGLWAGLAGAALCAWLLAGGSGCGKDSGPPDAPGDGVPVGPIYGSGTMSFEAGAAGRFDAAGDYKTSADFASDSSSRGAGGFVRDTVVSGKPMKGRLVAYTHTLRNSSLNERIMVFTIDSASGPVAPGRFEFSPPGAAPAGPSVSIVFLFFSDSLGVYSVYEAKKGALVLESFDAASLRLRGSFSGVLMPGGSADTTLQLVVMDGLFDITCVGSYFPF